MNVCVCMYVCMHVCMCMYVYVYICVYVYYVCACMRVCMYECVYICVYVCMYVYVYVYSTRSLNPGSHTSKKVPSPSTDWLPTNRDNFLRSYICMYVIYVCMHCMN